MGYALTPIALRVPLHHTDSVADHEPGRLARRPEHKLALAINSAFLLGVFFGFANNRF
jgi:hypothetical protein